MFPSSNFGGNTQSFFCSILNQPSIIEKLEKQHQNCDNLYKDRFPPFQPVCAKSHRAVKMALRSTLCHPKGCQACIYTSDYLNNKTDKVKCKKTGKQYTTDNLYVDRRLTNLIISFLELHAQGLQSEQEIQNFIKQCSIEMNQDGSLIVRYEKILFFQKTNNATTGGKLTKEDQSQTRMQVQSTIRRKCYQYLDSKFKMRMLTRNLQKESQIIVKEVGTKLVDEINQKAKSKMKIPKNQDAQTGCMFGFAKGQLYCALKQRPVQRYQIMTDDHRNKNDLAQFYGGGWFFAQVNSIPFIYVIGGFSCNSTEKIGKNMMEFRLQPAKKQAFWKPKFFQKDNSDFDIFHPGVIYNDDKKYVYIFGGLTKKDLKTALPCKSIHRMRIQDKSISLFGQLKQIRINQTYTSFKQKIYISCGLPLKSWKSEILIEEPIKKLRQRQATGVYNPLRLEVFDINNNNINVFEINMDNSRIQSFMYRCVSTVIPIPSKDSHVLLVFGGNPNTYGSGQHALAMDLKVTENFASEKIFAKDFGDDVVRRQVFVGNEFPISKTKKYGVNNIVDLQGIKTQNFSEWLCVMSNNDQSNQGDDKKVKLQQFALTSQENDFGYHWRF